MQVVDVLVLFVDESGDRLPDQRAPGRIQQCGGGEVGLQYSSLFGEGAIAHRRKVVQAEIPRPGGVQFRLGAAQFFVLHLQFDLVNPQLVQDPSVFFGRQGQGVSGRLSGVLPGFGFGPFAKRGCAVGQPALAGHGAPPAFFGSVMSSIASRMNPGRFASLTIRALIRMVRRPIPSNSCDSI